MQALPGERFPVAARAIAAFVLGLPVALGFAPYSAWWLLPLLVGAQAWLWLGTAPRVAFRIGFAFGFGAFLTGTYWLYHSVYTIGGTPIWLAVLLMLGLVLIMALYYGAVAATVSRIARGSVPVSIALLPGAWVLMEWLRGWVLSGFPWLSLGYSLPGTALAGVLPLGGVYAGSFVLVVIASALLALLATGRRAIPPAAAALLVVMAGAVGLHDRQFAEPGARRVTASIGQLGLEQRLKWTQEAYTTTLNWYSQFVAGAPAADLLVMPEVALPTTSDRIAPLIDRMAQTAQSRGSALVLGILRRDDAGVYNALLVREGRRASFYDKRHLVPFGEFFPVPSFVREWMRMRNLPFSDISRGRAEPAALEIDGLAVATSICYEDAYAAEQLTFFPDAAYIINVSNDGWFGDSIAPHHHLQIARTRSAESQRWQLRSTNSGITAIIDDRGRVVTQAPTFEPAVLTGTIATAAGHTPYTRTGNWPVLVVAALSLAIGGARVRRAPR